MFHKFAKQICSKYASLRSAGEFNLYFDLFDYFVVKKVSLKELLVPFIFFLFLRRFLLKFKGGNSGDHGWSSGVRILRIRSDKAGISTFLSILLNFIKLAYPIEVPNPRLREDPGNIFPWDFLF